MLGRKSYAKDYLEACRQRVARQLKAFDALGKKADVSALAPEFFAALILELEMAFVHRVRMSEGKDGNRLNEVRMLAASLLESGGVMTADSTIRYDPVKSVTGIAIGKTIVVQRDAFEKLAREFFSEIEKKYP